MAESNQYIDQLAEYEHQAASSTCRRQTRETLDEHLLNPVAEIEFGYYAELSKAKDPMDFKRRIGNVISRLGFSDFTFMRLTRLDVDSKLLVTVPDELLVTYFKEGLHEHDMILPYAERNDRPIYLSAIHDYVAQAPFETDLTRTMQAIYRLNKSFGYYDYYNVPVKARNGDGSVMLSVTQRGCSTVELKRKVRGCESALQLLCEAIDFVAMRKFPDILLGKAVEEKQVVIINPRPLRVLDTLANNDLNIAQVADKLSISVVTANKHLETARKAFGAKTNYAAIKQAVLSGLIEYGK